MRVHPSLYLSRIVCHTYTVWPPGMPPIEARSPDHTEHQTEHTQGTRECVRVFFFFFHSVCMSREHEQARQRVLDAMVDKSRCEMRHIHHPRGAEGSG